MLLLYRHQLQIVLAHPLPVRGLEREPDSVGARGGRRGHWDEVYYLVAGNSPLLKSPVMMSSLAAHRSTRAKLSMSTPSDTARSHLYESNLKYFSVPSNIFTTRITHSSASRVTATRHTWAASMAWSLMPASLQSQVPCLQEQSVWSRRMVQGRDRATVCHLIRSLTDSTTFLRRWPATSLASSMVRMVQTPSDSNYLHCIS